MTDREAIDCFRYCITKCHDCFPCAEHDEALVVALSVLQERSEGCRYCSLGADMKTDEDMEMNLFNYAEGMDFSVYPNFCPMCGRPLKGVDHADD